MKLDALTSLDPIIYVLIGLPASGKTTWTKQKTANSERTFIVISSDDVIQGIADSSGKSYNDVFKDNVGVAVKQTWQDLNSAINENNSIIWDQTNINAKKRMKIMRQIPKNYKKVAVVFNVSDTELHKRLENRSKLEGKTIPSHVISSMKKGFQEPQKSEGFDEILHN